MQECKVQESWRMPGCEKAGLLPIGRRHFPTCLDKVCLLLSGSFVVLKTRVLKNKPPAGGKETEFGNLFQFFRNFEGSFHFRLLKPVSILTQIKTEAWIFVPKTTQSKARIE